MAAAGSLQTATAAISIVQLAYQSYLFVVEVSNAHAEARLLSDRSKRLYDLIAAIDSRMDIRGRIRSSEPAQREESQIEDVVRASIRACRFCLVGLNRKLRGLTTEQPINFQARVSAGVRFVLSRQEREKQERALETNIQSLSTSLHLLQLLEHAGTQNRLDRLERALNKATAHLTNIGSYNQQQLPLSPLTALNVADLEKMEAASEDPDKLGIHSLRMTIEVARSVRSTYGSRFEPDRQSVARINDREESDDEKSDAEDEDDNNSRDSTNYDPMDANGRATAQSSSTWIGVPEAPDHPARSGPWPATQISILIKQAHQEAADREYANGCYVAAEEFQKQAFEYGERLENEGQEPFTNRKQIRQRLADIYMKQGKNFESIKELHNLLHETRMANSSEEKMEQAQLWRQLAQVHHSIFVANRSIHHHPGTTDTDLEKAWEYIFFKAFKLFEDLIEAQHIKKEDPEVLSSVDLVVQVLEDQGKIVEASVWRKEYLAKRASIVSLNSGMSVEEDAGPQTVVPIITTNGLPRLTSAILSDNEDEFQAILDEIVEKGGDLDERCPEDLTPLMHAVACKHKSSVGCDRAINKLVLHGAKINATTDDGSNVHTALHQAVAAGNEDKVLRLLERQADKDSCAPNTPLLLAVKKNQAKLLGVLLKSGADPTLAISDGWTLLHHAVSSNCYEALEVLLDPEYKDKIDIKAKCTRGQTALHFAAANVTNPWAYTFAEALLCRNADPNVLDDAKRSPLYFATNSARTESREEFVRLLLRYGADPELTPLAFRRRFNQYFALREVMEAKNKVPGQPPTRKNSASSGWSITRRDSKATIASTDTDQTTQSRWSKLGRTKSRNKGDL